VEAAPGAPEGNDQPAAMASVVVPGPGGTAPTVVSNPGKTVASSSRKPAAWLKAPFLSGPIAVVSEGVPAARPSAEVAAPVARRLVPHSEQRSADSGFSVAQVGQIIG